MSVKVLSIEDDGVASLACEGELNGLGLSDKGEGFKPVLGDGWAKRRVSLDLGDANYMDSATIGWLLSLHKAFADAGGKLVVHDLQPGVKRVVEMMRINQVLNLADDREHAVARLRAKGQT